MTSSVGAEEPSVCVVAVGGFGRRWLFPRSDVDLLFVHRPGFDREAEALATRVLYPLWDAGLQVSHAVRTPNECVREAERDLKSLTTVLGARLLIGPPDLFEEARQGVVRAIRQDPLHFIDALRRSRDERRERFGVLHHQQEPDLKEAVGGIRDLHLGWWLIQALGAGDRPDPAISADDLATLSTEEPTLMAARAVLHGATLSSSDRLLADLQPTVAMALGIRPVEGWTPEDRLMRLVLGEARGIDVRVESWLEELAAGFGSDRTRPRFVLGTPNASLAGTIQRFATMAERNGVAASSELAPDATREWPRARWSLDGVDTFLRLIAAGEAGSRALETMDVLTLMTRLLPEWDRVAGRPQRDPYHRFPVDVHLRATAAEAARLLRDADEPFAVEAVRSVDDPDALLLGALLHDIGKVGKGSHVAAGVESTGRILSRLGVVETTRDHVLFLVREHLLLSDVATRRNLEDEDLILHVASRIRDERRLAMLYLLTIADAVATGPSASTPWRMTLVRDLVAKVSHVFARGTMDRVQAKRLEEARVTVRRELASLPTANVDSFLDGVPTSYLLQVQPSEVAGHLPLVQPAPGPDEVRTSIRPGRSPGTHAVAVAAPDRLGLLSAVAGAMTLSGLSVLTAQVFTTEQGVALDLFEVRGAFEPEVAEDRWGRFEEMLREALGGRKDLAGEVESLRSHYRPPSAAVPLSVALHQDASDFFTVVEVGGPDRLGLLFDLTSALAGHGFDVHSAKVATYGPRVVDVFYVTDADGQKVTQPDREAELERALAAAVSPR